MGNTPRGSSGQFWDFAGLATESTKDLIYNCTQFLIESYIGSLTKDIC